MDEMRRMGNNPVRRLCFGLTTYRRIDGRPIFRPLIMELLS